MEESIQNQQRLPEADTGNASNPSPHSHEMEPVNDNQLIDQRGEKYLREAANIEDEPDAQDQKDADELIQKNNSQNKCYRQNNSTKRSFGWKYKYK